MMIELQRYVGFADALFLLTIAFASFVITQRDYAKVHFLLRVLMFALVIFAFWCGLRRLSNLFSWGHGVPIDRLVFDGLLSVMTVIRMVSPALAINLPPSWVARDLHDALNKRVHHTRA